MVNNSIGLRTCTLLTLKIRCNETILKMKWISKNFCIKYSKDFYISKLFS